MIHFAVDRLWVAPAETVLDSFAVVMVELRWVAFPCPVVAVDGCSRGLRGPAVQDLVVPNLVDMVGAEDIASAVEGHLHDLAFDDQDSHRGHWSHCLGVEQEVAVALVDHLAVMDRNHPGTEAEVSNFLANVANTVAIEDYVVDMVTFAVVRAFLLPVHRDWVPSCSHRAYAADGEVAFDILELPCLLAKVVVRVDPAVDHQLTIRMVADSVMLHANDPAVVATVIDYRGLDYYYYYYLVDSVLADLELGSDYWRDAEASVNSADL